MTEVLPWTKKRAIAIGAPFYYTGMPCRRGHRAERYTSDGHCFECQRLKNLRRAGRRRNRSPDELATNRQHAKNYYAKLRAAYLALQIIMNQQPSSGVQSDADQSAD